jgi:hypothetical protein
MRFALLAFAFLLPAAAHAQQALPVMLTPQEYQAVVTELMGRDPILRMLVQKQDHEQMVAARAKAEPAKPATDTEAK